MSACPDATMPDSTWHAPARAHPAAPRAPARRKASPVTCPNSTESGCRCPEHHPGLGVVIEPVVLKLVTAGPRELSSDEIVDRALDAARAECAACNGDAERCRAGTSAPKFDRLKGCKAFDSAGDIAPLKAKAQPRQPWEPKVA